MIDIESAVFDPIAAALEAEFPGVNVSGEYVREPSDFPHVSIEEVDNYPTQNRLDSSGAERYATSVYEVNVYSAKAVGKKSECREILALIDEMLFRRNFIRLSVSPVPNLEDASIYRLTARYRVETDGERFFRLKGSRFYK